MFYQFKSTCLDAPAHTRSAQMQKIISHQITHADHATHIIYEHIRPTQLKHRQTREDTKVWNTLTAVNLSVVDIYHDVCAGTRRGVMPCAINQRSPRDGSEGT